MNATVIDETTATKALTQARTTLEEAVFRLDQSTTVLNDLIVNIRPSGLLTVDEMAEALGRDRNYVDTVWSNSGSTVKGAQTRVKVEGDAVAARAAFESLKTAAGVKARALREVGVARAERNRVVALVYGSKLLGPVRVIADVAGIDRNHVLRIARKAGIGPVHRTNAKNQYSAN